jgi:hypothetical protein
MRDAARSTQNKLKPPPNYQSRGMQMRLFAMVAGLMLVITLAFETRNPQRWAWINKLSEPTARVDELDTRVKRDEQVTERKLNELEIAAPNRSEPVENKQDKDAELPPDALAWKSAWRDIYDGLSQEQRMVLFELLKQSRENKINDDELTAVETIAEMERLWQVYRGNALASLQTLSDTEKQAWQPIINGIEQKWQTEIKPALSLLAANELPTESARANLAAFETLCDEYAFRFVHDNSFWRNDDREAWFRLIGNLQSVNAHELQKQSEGFINYTQLFKQSNSYRGKVVTVRGRADAVYRTPAQKNSYGVSEYWVYWLFPDGGPPSPLVVYALRKPDGFPSQNQADAGQPLSSQEEVEFHGYFFKRLAYEGKGGTFIAPLVVAAEPIWKKPNEIVSTTELPSLYTSLLTVTLIAALAVGLAVWVYYQYRPGGTRPILEHIDFTTPNE